MWAKERRLIGCVLAVLAGLLCLWAGVLEARLQARLRRYGVHAEGVVVDQYLAPSGDFELTPVIEFTDRQGRPVRFTPVATGQRMGWTLEPRYRSSICPNALSLHGCSPGSTSDPRSSACLPANAALLMSQHPAVAV